MRKIVWQPLALVIVVLCAYIGHVAIEIAHQSARDEARPADLIMVLGAAEYRGRPSPVLKARLDHALELYRRKLAPRILTTGGPGRDPLYTEGGVGRAYLSSRDVPSEDILVEAVGESTVHSIAAAGEIMRRLGLSSCIVVSDGYHIYRVKKMLEFQGIRVYGSPRTSSSPGSSWQYIKQAVGYVLWSIGVPV